MTGDGGVLQDVRRDLALRVSDDQRMPGQHPVGDRGQDDALRLARTRTAQRQDAARHVLAAERKASGSHIEPPFLFAPERAEQGQPFRILAAKAAVLAGGAEVRRSQRPAFNRWGTQTVDPLAQPATVPEQTVQSERGHEQGERQHRTEQEQPHRVHAARRTDQESDDRTGVPASALHRTVTDQRQIERSDGEQDHCVGHNQQPTLQCGRFRAFIARAANTCPHCCRRDQQQDQCAAYQWYEQRGQHVAPMREQPVDHRRCS